MDERGRQHDPMRPPADTICVVSAIPDPNPAPPTPLRGWKLALSLGGTLVLLVGTMFVPFLIHALGWAGGQDLATVFSVFVAVAAVAGAFGKIFEKVERVPGWVNRVGGAAVVVGGFYLVAWGLFAIDGSLEVPLARLGAGDGQ